MMMSYFKGAAWAYTHAWQVLEPALSLEFVTTFRHWKHYFCVKRYLFLSDLLVNAFIIVYII